MVEACSLFLSPHTAFGLAFGTPWLTIPGGRWCECYFNHLPFRPIIPDAKHYPGLDSRSWRRRRSPGTAATAGGPRA
jgi:hypothetical protein